MGNLMDMFTGNRGKVMADSMVALTESGKKRIEDIGYGTSVLARIMVALHGHQPQSVRELAQENQFDLDAVKSGVDILRKQGLVKVTYDE